MMIVPLQAVKSQNLSVQLGDQQCIINLYQRFYGVFIDLYASSSSDNQPPPTILIGQICENLNLIVRSAYLGFSGDLAFVDTQGSDNPIYTGLGSRFLLYYLSPSDVAAIPTPPVVFTFAPYVPPPH